LGRTLYRGLQRVAAGFLHAGLPNVCDPAERAWMADELLHDQTLDKIRCILTGHAADDADMAA